MKFTIYINSKNIYIDLFIILLAITIVRDLVQTKIIFNFF